MWNYAQHFAMNDNAYADTYGPSSPGMLNISSGQTNGMVIVSSTKPPSTVTDVTFYVKDGYGGLTMINDVDPADDKCSKGDVVKMVGKTIGDLLNNDGITWGSFMGGYRLDKTNPNGTTDCLRSTRPNLSDYIPHHAWFQYYASTANPLHLRPSTLAAIGYSLEADGTTRDPANHNYDLGDFYDAVKAGNFPSVSYVKLPAYQDGHAGYSNPLDEQAGTVELINFLEQQPDWKSTAVIITWDDSDGWYDHVAAKVTSPSFDSEADRLDGPGKCGSGMPPLGVKGEPVNGRCGPGTRLPFLVISPWARANYVDHTQVSLASVVRFIEDNWLHGARIGGGSFDATAGSLQGMFDFAGTGNTAALLLDPQTGTPMAAQPAESAR